MPVYVDSMFSPEGTQVPCHLIADTDEELHEMARMIGVQRWRWQSPDKGKSSYYEISLEKRGLSITHGAVPISTNVMACMTARRKRTGSLGEPGTAVKWVQDDYARRLKEIVEKVAQ